MQKTKFKIVLFGLLILSMIFAGCSSNEKPTNSKAEIPNLKVGYIFTNHQTPLMVAAEKGEEFKENGVYLKEVVERQKYTLMKNDETMANIELVVTKSGSETMTMMGQGHIDMGLASSAACITAIDKGTKIKILNPVHTEGIGLVVGKESPINNWEDFKKSVKEGDLPFKVGYHSPTSAPVILFEAALNDSGLTGTYNPEDMNADILFVDLKGTSNLIPALTSKQVDAWVGPSPYPELSVTEDIGKIVLDMKHLPPEGKWYDFPCCVASATEEVIEKNPEIVEAFSKVLTIAADYSENHKEEAAKITAEFTGVSEEAAKMATIKYTTNPSETWVENVGLIVDALRKANKLSDAFVDEEYENIKEKIYDFSFVNKALEK
ncbi:ABC transporter substrate-binding protein [Wukongibacter sp. M2B1]|uniref:ABC transporter substrate-binding protein n=1 Tax=Wukongibacter sp. M2B1 TaxID=3088895 RepID=UPI003D79E880